MANGPFSPDYILFPTFIQALPLVGYLRKTVIGLIVAWYMWKSRSPYFIQMHPLNPLSVLAKTFDLYHRWKVVHDPKSE